jgi:hypothetical protein
MKALELGTLEDKQISWQVAHEALSRLARARAAADAEEGRWLLAAQRAAVHVHLGFSSFSEYIERLFGYQPRSLQERLRVAEALEGLPALARALSSGELSWSAVRELTRVAVRDTEREWLEFARGKTLRQLEQVLASRRSGDTPASPPDPAARRHTLRFDVLAETLALMREALSELRRRAGASLDDDAALIELARCVLQGPREEGRASYQIVLRVCPECGNGQQQAAGGLVPVNPDVIRMAHCDAQHIGRVAGPSPTPANDLEPDARRDEHDTTSHPAAPSRASAHVGAPAQPSSLENLSAHLGAAAQPSSLENQSAHLGAAAQPSSSSLENLSAHLGAPAQPSSSSLETQSAHMGAPAQPSSSSLENLSAAAVVEKEAAVRHETGSRSSQTRPPALAAPGLPRAKQTIPPALRRAVLLRDQHRCQVPGCSNARWLDIHHIELRSKGGRHSLQNLLCVCGAHHRAAHRGEISIDRSESGALRVRHADGTEYGRNVQPQLLELRAKVFSALRQLGFREGQVRAALEQLQREPTLAQTSFDSLLRAALARLRSPGAQR